MPLPRLKDCEYKEQITSIIKSAFWSTASVEDTLGINQEKTAFGVYNNELLQLRTYTEGQVSTWYFMIRGKFICYIPDKLAYVAYQQALQNCLAFNEDDISKIVAEHELPNKTKLKRFNL